MSNLNSDLHTWCFCLGFFHFPSPCQCPEFCTCFTSDLKPRDALCTGCHLKIVQKSVFTRALMCFFRSVLQNPPDSKVQLQMDMPIIYSQIKKKKKKSTHTQYWIFRLLVVNVWGLEIVSLTDPFSLLVDLYHSRVSLRSLEIFFFLAAK